MAASPLASVKPDVKEQPPGMGPYLIFLYFDFEGTRGIYFRMGFRLMDLLDHLYRNSSGTRR